MDIDELRKRLSLLPPLPPSKPYTWPFRQADIRKQFQTQPHPEEFLKWPFSRDFLFATQGHKEAFRYVQSRHPELLPAALDGKFGLPDLYYGYDTNLLNQCYYLAVLMDVVDIECLTELKDVYEFGGGYGAMRLVFERMDFNGVYTIQDLDEMLLLQQYYLDQMNVDLLATNFFNFTPNLDVDLFIACCSLSEVEDDIRRQALESVQSDFYLIVYQDSFYDNHNFFQSFMKERTDHEWFNFRSSTVPGHWFLLGQPL